ncbi:MAG: electron transporter RnfB [Bacilli bacterium]|jgi:electron transport complex protein RnfB|nr:electron transporter RnfB [Bacilli bacterium]
MIDILIAVAITLAISAALGLLLAVASKYLAVKEDPRVGEVLKLLPGANCGGCGFPGCSGMADSLVNGGNKNLSACRPCKAENKAKIIEYLANTPGPDGSTITGVK